MAKSKKKADIPLGPVHFNLPAMDERAALIAAILMQAEKDHQDSSETGREGLSYHFTQQLTLNASTETYERKNVWPFLIEVSRDIERYRDIITMIVTAWEAMIRAERYHTKLCATGHHNRDSVECVAARDALRVVREEHRQLMGTIRAGSIGEAMRAYQIMTGEE